MNLLAAIDTHLQREIDACRKDAAEALGTYIAAKRREMELVMLRDLRAAVTPDDAEPQVTPLTGAAA